MLRYPGRARLLPSRSSLEKRGSAGASPSPFREHATALDRNCTRFAHACLPPRGSLPSGSFHQKGMMSMRILVADKLADEGLEALKHEQMSFDAKVGLKEDELAAAVGSYDALVVRSGAKVTAKVLANPGNLKAIARAGVGVDNIDLDAATAKGILVLNTAEASTLSTA